MFLNQNLAGKIQRKALSFVENLDRDFKINSIPKPFGSPIEIADLIFLGLTIS